MSDQLSLLLETDRLPDLPDLRPMQPRPLPEAFDSAEHLFEPWWGGVRALALIGPADAPGDGVVRIVDAEGLDVSAALPELAGMAVRVAARSAILDGELVVVDAAGRADQATLAARLAGGEGRPAAFLADVPAMQAVAHRREVSAGARPRASSSDTRASSPSPRGSPPLHRDRSPASPSTPARRGLI
jgi:hypothetical protein